MPWMETTMLDERARFARDSRDNGPMVPDRAMTSRARLSRCARATFPTSSPWISRPAVDPSPRRRERHTQRTGCGRRRHRRRWAGSFDAGAEQWLEWATDFLKSTDSIGKLLDDPWPTAPLRAATSTPWHWKQPAVDPLAWGWRQMGNDLNRHGRQECNLRTE